MSTVWKCLICTLLKHYYGTEFDCALWLSPLEQYLWLGVLAQKQNKRGRRYKAPGQDAHVHAGSAEIAGLPAIKKDNSVKAKNVYISSAHRTLFFVERRMEVGEWSGKNNLKTAEKNFFFLRYEITEPRLGCEFQFNYSRTRAAAAQRWLWLVKHQT
jgi:hypothetical protein